MDHNMDHERPMESMGSMYFHTNVQNTILFQEWQTRTWQELLGSCIGIAVIAALYEGFKVGREYLEYRMERGKDKTTGCQQNNRGDEASTKTAADSTIIAIGDGETQKTTKRPEILSLRHLLQTGLHFVQLWIAFCLMLIFMTYSVYLCLAITVGGAIGYFCFAWMRPAPFLHSTAYPGDCCN